MIKNIFGLNTQDINSQRDAIAKTMAESLVKNDNTNPAVAAFGTAFGSKFGRGLMNKLGFEDTEMEAARANEQKQLDWQAEISKYEDGSPEQYIARGRGQLEAGNYDAATANFEMARKLGEPSKVATENAKHSLNVTKNATTFLTNLINTYRISPVEAGKLATIAFPGLGEGVIDKLLFELKTQAGGDGSAGGAGGRRLTLEQAEGVSNNTFKPELNDTFEQSDGSVLMYTVDPATKKPKWIKVK